MGFLDREQKLRQEQEVAQRIQEAEKARLAMIAVTQNRLAMQAMEDDKKWGPEDDAKIVDLLSHLPKFDLLSYLHLVKKHTGYDNYYCFYTRGPGIGRRNPELVDKLWEFNIKTDVYESRGTKHPNEMFCGTGAKPKITSYGGFLNLFSTEQFIFEPQEPGIGICFVKSGTRKVGSYSRQDPLYSFHTHEFEETETTSQFVFVRLLSPATAFITGNGQRIPIASIEALDNALEDGFKHYHVKKERHESEVYRDIGG